MRTELEQMGLPVVVAGVNAPSAVANQSDLIAKAAFPLFQDQSDVDVFAVQGGSKDDFFVYDRQGRLYKWFPVLGPVNSNLATDEGYKNVKTAVIEAASR